VLVLVVGIEDWVLGLVLGLEGFRPANTNSKKISTYQILN
jgi:hypothetical protein